MRPLRLEMEGFGTFSQRTTVDFGGADFFALVGPTGAGKSTVMDAICFALYGRAPRWGQGIEYALAPSATTGKVQLVFAAADRVYVATRVVRRGAKGRVTTASAALERLASDVDASTLTDVTGLIGTSLAGSAKAVTEQVEHIVGLPFEQFTKCVLLPQGAFADFLHAGAAERRKILENLLGHTIYGDIQTAAGEERRNAEAVLSHIESQLAQLTPVGDEDLEAASRRITQLAELDTSVRRTVPRLEELARASEEAAAILKVVDEEHSLLTYIRKPSDADSLADELAEASQAVTQAKQAVTAREETEEQLRTQIGDTDLGLIEQLLADHASATKLNESLAKGRPLTVEAQQRRDGAQSERDAAAAALVAAQEAVHAAKENDVAASLRHGLVPGDACPVCRQSIPENVVTDHDAGVAEAQKLEATARRAMADAEKRLSQAQEALARYRARLDEVTAMQEEVSQRLKDAPPEKELNRRRAEAEHRKARLSEASTAVRTAREDLRRAEKSHQNVQDRLRSEWQRFDHHRDRVARLAPPPADRGDLKAAWHDLAQWAARELKVRKTRRAEQLQIRDELDDKTRAVRHELTALLAEAGVPLVTGDATSDFAETVAAARHEAKSERDRLKQARAQHIELSRQRSVQAERTEVAKHLHQHLGARRFINWLLSEAIDELVEGASAILSKLTDGQYNLISHDDEFYVVDHHDADLTRPVKTLSGGETFAAALSLALAMSDQLAGMSSQGACLEAILLDEGFGTLDAATLDQVAANLENLATSGTRMVGVVTHVAGLAERIPVRYEVSKNASGSHVERVNV